MPRIGSLPIKKHQSSTSLSPYDDINIRLSLFVCTHNKFNHHHFPFSFYFMFRRKHTKETDRCPQNHPHKLLYTQTTLCTHQNTFFICYFDHHQYHHWTLTIIKMRNRNYVHLVQKDQKYLRFDWFIIILCGLEKQTGWHFIFILIFEVLKTNIPVEFKRTILPYKRYTRLTVCFLFSSAWNYLQNHHFSKKMTMARKR